MKKKLVVSICLVCFILLFGCGSNQSDQEDHAMQNENERYEVQTDEPIKETESSMNDNNTAMDSSITFGMENALETARDYLKIMPFSAFGLYDQLEYEGYLPDECQYAVDHCDADWNEQAALAAQQYLDIMSFSKEELIDQLQYEGYTYSQAVYGAEANGY